MVKQLRMGRVKQKGLCRDGTERRESYLFRKSLSPERADPGAGNGRHEPTVGRFLSSRTSIWTFWVGKDKQIYTWARESFYNYQ